MQARTGCAGCLALALIWAGCVNGQATPPGIAALPMPEPPGATISQPSLSDPAAPAPAAPDPAAPEPAAQQPAAPAAGMEPAKSRVPSLFSAKRDEDLGIGSLFLGDLDRDGHDDFFIMAMLPLSMDGRISQSGPVAHIYLYYGRASFPARLSTDDADAVFETMGGGGPLGDVNGDGYADFAIQGRTGVEIVFGSPQRLRGTIAEGTAGVRWKAPPVPQALQAQVGALFMEVYATGVGDYNGDGYDDMVVMATRILDPTASAFNAEVGISASAYLVLGHAGDWPSAEWNPSWSVARFGDLHVADDATTGMVGYDYPLMPMPAGDLDKDGRADLLAQAQGKSFLFYGGRTLSGIVAATQADATITTELYPDLVPIGDADGDGAADLVASSQANLVQVIYGRRWTGTVSPQPDFTIDLNDLGGGRAYAAAGDIDGDGSPEIVVAAPMSGYDFSFQRPPTGALYAVRGTGSRAVGTYRLTDENLLLRGPLAGGRAENSNEGGLGTTLNMDGDVDGDGGFDILTSTPGAVVSAQSLGAVFLVPSTRKTAL
ncbi:MAG TPA: FG-GAP-like repeat-containing protein [Polyangiales bacterium]|nr:FG-GAP-like repeat-containing protein [Polyangiales bacterium]